MKCLVCGQKTQSLKAGVINGKYLSDRCESCFIQESKGYRPMSEAAKFDRDMDIKDNFKDIIQPYTDKGANSDFVKAYPEEAKQYFTKEELRRSEL